MPNSRKKGLYPDTDIRRLNIVTTRANEMARGIDLSSNIVRASILLMTPFTCSILPLLRGLAGNV